MTKLNYVLCWLGRYSLLTIIAFGAGAADTAVGQEKPAEPAVKALNNAVLSKLPFTKQDDFQDAARGFIATLPDGLVTGPNGNVVWSQKDYAFLEGTSPDTVNPSLWRQAQLNHQHGLFKVVDGVYQVRGIDLSNMTILEGDTGLIVVDTLLSVETAKAALELYYQHRPRRPVVAVIYTHTHADHWGGVKGVTTEADVASGKVAVLAPEGFLEHAASEGIIAGNAQRRRSLYQFGPLLPKGERGQVDGGLGKTISLGSLSLIPPTDLIRKSGEKRIIDGVEIIFAMAPETEAPAELYMYYPRFKVLNMAEIATHNFHNLLPLRGTEVRDALAWSKHLGEAVETFGNESEAVIAQHHWPVFGKDRARNFLINQRDLYKYEHDQTVRLMNQGFTAPEIAEQLELPQASPMSGRTAVTTAPCVTMPKRSTRNILDGTTTIQRTSIPFPPFRRPKSTSPIWAGRTPSSGAHAKTSKTASTVSWRRSQTSLCLPTRPTRKHAISPPTRTNSSAIWRNPPHGAMHIFMPLLNCATAPLKLAVARR